MFLLGLTLKILVQAVFISFPVFGTDRILHKKNEPWSWNKSPFGPRLFFNFKSIENVYSKFEFLHATLSEFEIFDVTQKIDLKSAIF